MKTILTVASVVAVLVGVAGLGAAYYASHRPAVKPTVAVAPKAVSPKELKKPEKPRRGNSPDVIVVTGTVKPEEVVEVGAQVNGMVVAVGADRAEPGRSLDQGSIVHKGEVLAQIDPTIYKAQVDYAEASLAKAKSDLQQLVTRSNQLKSEWQRAQALMAKKAIAGSDYDLASANCQAALDNVVGGRATVQQCEASLQVAKTYLSYTVITAPIDGVILERRVTVGQIVCATFNVPGLFVVAKDLRRPQIWASVGEVDIGHISPGMPVKFTVDAYPGETFDGKVSRIRLNPVTAQDRTTYTVIVATSTSRGMLPYLTAKLRFDISTRDVKTANTSGLDVVAER